VKGWTRCGNSRFYSLESGEPGIKDILDPTSMTVIRLSSAFDRTIVGAYVPEALEVLGVPACA
jgi:hypothetical protein